MTSPLLDPPPISPAELGRLEDAVKQLLATRLDIVLPQAEAILALEATARGLGRPGLVALNLDTRPYGAVFGRWLAEAGTKVIGISPEAHKAVSPQAVEQAFKDNPEISLVSFVHAEAASGVCNDAEAICAIAREHGALVVLDAVASFGAHEVPFDGWGVDVAVIGPQKALAGPAGISITAVSQRAWQAMADNPGAPRGSSLSLLDWKELWLDTGRSALFLTPSPLEILALEAAVERFRAEGLPQVLRRHRAARRASRAGARELGLVPFVDDADAAAIATTLTAPAGLDARVLVARATTGRSPAISAGFDEFTASMVRIDHIGQRARLSVILEAIEALGTALAGLSQLRGSIPAALAATQQAWAADEAHPEPKDSR